MTHDHNHNHHQNHAPQNFNRAFIVGIVLNISFVIIESAYGFISNSLALLADAGHNLSDVLGLVIAWVAIILSNRKPNHQFTFGLKGSSILAALGNSVFLLVTIGAIIWEAIDRFQNPTMMNSPIVIAVALVGVIINGVTAFLFRRGHKQDINIKGAYLHMLADAMVSVGVAMAGVLFIFTKWTWLDPLVSIIVCVIIFKGTWSLLKESVQLALKAVPTGIDRALVFDFLKSQKNVTAVHDLHIWGMSTTENALTAHLVIPQGHPGDGFLHHLAIDLKSNFNIGHSTIQIELGNDSAHRCELESDDVV
jgi:cobalt-zinc-cadmium efflux system protein